MDYLYVLPPWLEEKLDNPPPAGTGVHRWIASCAWHLVGRVPITEARLLITVAASQCGREVPTREIDDALRTALEKRKTRGSGSFWDRESAKPKNPPPNWAAIEAIAARGQRLSDLKALSPDSHTRTSWEWLELLFPGNPLLSLAASQYDHRTLPLNGWRKFGERFSLMVPSPMSATKGRAKAGHESGRCEDNTGPRLYQVVECDFKPDEPGAAPTPAGILLAKLAAESPPRNSLDLCASILMDLKDLGAPLLLVVHSGGKSLHGWFPVRGQADSALRGFFEHCITLGADPATWSKCQLVRLPGGVREGTGRRQPVHYFDPSQIPSH